MRMIFGDMCSPVVTPFPYSFSGNEFHPSFTKLLVPNSNLCSPGENCFGSSRLIQVSKNMIAYSKIWHWTSGYFPTEEMMLQQWRNEAILLVFSWASRSRWGGWSLECSSEQGASMFVHRGDICSPPWVCCCWDTFEGLRIGFPCYGSFSFTKEATGGFLLLIISHLKWLILCRSLFSSEN